MMDDSYPAPMRTRNNGTTRLLLATALAAFVVGAAGVFALDHRDEIAAGTLFAAPAPAPSPAPRSTPPLARQPLSAAQMQQGMEARVTAMEQRLAQLDLRAQAASGNAARAEGLLIAFAARRALERGSPLGYLADQLRLRFADAQPRAVGTVIAAAANPITLDQLIARLDGLHSQLAGPPDDEGVLAWLRREAGTLFVIRREDTPSPAAEQRLQRARLFLETGRIDPAIAEVRLLPNAGSAAAWVTDARRYSAAQHALELLETTAILDARALRDRTGQPVEQLSPLAEPAPEPVPVPTPAAPAE